MMSRPIGVAVLAIVSVIAAMALNVPALASEQVATAVRVIYPGQIIEPDMVKIVRLKRAMANAGRAVGRLDGLIGKVAAKTILPNRLIFPTDFTEGNIVEPGQAVRVIYQTDAITISLEAVALEGGVAGDVVRIRNRDSARIVSGRVSDNGIIYVSAR